MGAGMGAGHVGARARADADADGLGVRWLTRGINETELAELARSLSKTELTRSGLHCLSWCMMVHDAV